MLMCMNAEAYHHSGREWCGSYTGWSHCSCYCYYLGGSTHNPGCVVAEEVSDF